MKRKGLDQFGREAICTYRGDQYRVRDNGAVRRLRRITGRRRPLDDVWTFGKPSAATGYMQMSSVPVHRIVATAFHGAQPTGSHVVDHIDTNRRNNRPENLRWVTRLENLLMNPITAKRIALAYGSIDAFFEDPSRPLIGRLSPDLEWMRTVSPQEAATSRERLLAWARSDRAPSGGSLAEWIYESKEMAQPVDEPEDQLVDAKTPGAVQRNWRVPAEFPHCPGDIGSDALDEYRERLRYGEVFARTPFGESTIVSAEIAEGDDALVVLCNHGKDAVKDWSVARVTIEDGCFVHESLHTFFSLDGAAKQFTLARGLPWNGGDSIDDYC